jgi:hypothetical protein
MRALLGVEWNFSFVADSKTLLPWLMGAAIGAGGIFQGLHWRSLGEGPAGQEDRLKILLDENAILKRENESLRSLAQGGGEVAVPAEAIARVEKEFGLKFISSPVVHRIASEELRDRVAAAIESRFGPSGIDDRKEAYQWIGWLGPDDDLLSQLTVVRTTGARGWFDDVTGEAWITDRFDDEAIPDQAAMLRLISRILLHQHFPPAAAYPGDDAARAREALHQGAAAGVESRFLAINALKGGFMSMRSNVGVEQLFASLPPFIQGLTTFPVVEGKGYADSLHVQGGEKLLAALREPPLTTRKILQPELAEISDKRIEITGLPEEPYLNESAGQLGLRLWLERAGDVGMAHELSSCWVGDRYLLVPDGEASTAVIWEIELDSAEAAEKFQSVALEIVSAVVGTKETIKLGSVALAPDRRHLVVTRPRGTAVRFINAATKVFAEKFN